MMCEPHSLRSTCPWHTPPYAFAHFLLALAYDAPLNAVGVPRLLTGRSWSSLGRPTRPLRWWTRAVCWPCVSLCFDPGPAPMAHPAPAVPCLVAKRRLRAPWVACCGCWLLRPVQGVDPPFGPSSSATCRMWCWGLSLPPRLLWRPLTPCTAPRQGDCGQRSELKGGRGCTLPGPHSLCFLAQGAGVAVAALQGRFLDVACSVATLLLLLASPAPVIGLACFRGSPAGQSLVRWVL